MTTQPPLWDVASGKKIQTFQGHTDQVYTVALSGDGKRILTGSEDKTAILWAVKIPPAEADAQSAAFEQWLTATQKLPAEKQVEAVAAKLKEFHADFDGKMEPVIQDGKVVKLTLHTDVVTNLSPVRALKSLYWLSYRGSAPCTAKFTDLASLQGTSISHLDLVGTQVADLTPLRGLPIVHLNCAGTLVTDLSAFEGRKLAYLNIGGTGVRSLAPLKGMTSLSSLICNDSFIDDLSPLAGLRLETFGYVRMPVSDISVLRDMPLKDIGCSYRPERDKLLRSIKTLETINSKPAAQFWKEVDANNAAFEQWLTATRKLPAGKQVEAVAAKLKELNPGFDGKESHKLDKDGAVTELEFITDNVTDISPLRALPGLRTLNISSSGKYYEKNSRLADLAPLKGMELRHLYVRGTAVSDLSPLHGMKLAYLGCGYTKVVDLSPLKDMKLDWLDFCGTQVGDLSPLKDMKLTHLGCLETPVSDLSPLKDMKLRSLNCARTQVSDLSQIKDMPLKDIYVTFNPHRDTEVLRSIRTLETINQMPAAEFWKKVNPTNPAFEQWIKDTQKLARAEAVRCRRRQAQGTQSRIQRQGDALDRRPRPTGAPEISQQERHRHLARAGLARVTAPGVRGHPARA